MNEDTTGWEVECRARAMIRKAREADIAQWAKQDEFALRSAEPSQ